MWFDLYDLNGDICDKCGDTAGRHHGTTAACRINGGNTYSTTDKFVYANTSANSSDWFRHIHFDDLCANCGRRCGSHAMIDAMCPHSTTSSWAPKNGTTKQPDPFIKAPELIAAAKPLSKECPCGINRSQCTYHAQ